MADFIHRDRDEVELELEPDLQSFAARANRKELLEALKSAQLKNDELKARNKALEDELAALKALQTIAISKKQKSKSTTSNLSYSESLRSWAKAFSVVGQPWLKRSVFEVEKHANSDFDMSTARFVSDDVFDQGTFAALSKIVPQKHHADMVHLTDFHDTFIHYIGAQCYQSVHSANMVASVIFGHPAQWFDRTAYKRGEEKALQDMLKWKPEEGYKLLAPILYPNLVKDTELMFCVRHFPLILRVILWGPKGLNTTVKTTSDTLGVKWGIKRTMPPMMALSIVLAKYIVSPDTSFSEVGDVSKIPYWKEFRQYLQIIITKENTPSMRETINFFDRIVFDGVNSASKKVSEGADEDSEDEMNELFKEFNELELADTENPSQDSDPSPLSSLQPEAASAASEALAASIPAPADANVLINNTAAQPPKRRGGGRKAAARNNTRSTRSRVDTTGNEV